MKVCSTTLILAACMLSPMVLAERVESINPAMNATHMIMVGGSYQTADAAFRASVPELPEIEIDLDDLALDDKDVSLSLEYRWRFAEKWLLAATAYTFKQDGSRRIKRDFNFDGNEYEAGASLKTSLQVNTYIVDVLYSVYRTERAEIMLGGGFHVLDLDTSIKGRAFVGNIERESAKGSSEILAPLPNVRAQGFYALTDKWGMSINLGWLSANVDDYEGGFSYVYGRVGYSFTEHIALNLGYQFTDFDLKVQESRGREAEFDVGFHGPTLSLSYRF
ncbi:MAG: outer membrane beta-barrel protein [Halioglobus sp.]